MIQPGIGPIRRIPRRRALGHTKKGRRRGHRWRYPRPQRDGTIRPWDGWRRYPAALRQSMRDNHPVPTPSSASSKRIDSRSASNRRERRPAARTMPPRAAQCRQKKDSPQTPPTATMRRDHLSSVGSETSFGSPCHSCRLKARAMPPRAARCRQEIDSPPTPPMTTTRRRWRRSLVVVGSETTSDVSSSSVFGSPRHRRLPMASGSTEKLYSRRWATESTGPLLRRSNSHGPSSLTPVPPPHLTCGWRGKRVSWGGTCPDSSAGHRRRAASRSDRTSTPGTRGVACAAGGSLLIY